MTRRQPTRHHTGGCQYCPGLNGLIFQFPSPLSSTNPSNRSSVKPEHGFSLACPGQLPTSTSTHPRARPSPPLAVTTDLTLYSDWLRSSTDRVSLGRNSSSASPSANLSSKASSPYASTRSSSEPSLQRPSKMKSPRMSLTRARYETLPGGIQPTKQLTSSLGLWPCKSKVRFHLRLVLADPEYPLHSIRRPAQNLVPHRPLADTLPARSVLRRDHALCHILLDLQHHLPSPFPPTFLLRHLCSRREIRFQQADAQVVAH